MKHSTWALCALLVLAAQLSVHAKIHHSVVDTDDRKLVPLTDAFGFSDGGRINITIKDIALYIKHDKDDYQLDHFGFFLSPVEADAALEQDLADDSKCILDEINSLFTFKDSGIQKVINKEWASFSYSAELENGGLYYLYFANCEPNTPVSFDSRIIMYNEFNGKVDYLSVGETELEAMYWVMFALFTSILISWGYYMWQQRQYVQRVHYLMAGLCLFKSLTVMSQAGMYHYIERTGSADGWNIAYYIFTFFRGILFFVVVVLIGTGWSYMKPFLGDKEKRILLVVIPLQVFANVAIVITEEQSPAVKDWFTWRDVFHLLDIICCCAILFPIVWSIKHLREASQTDGKAARNLEKLTLFRQFYVMVVVYIYFTRIVVYLLKSTMQYEYAWVSEAASQFATLAFYVWTAVKFRPQSNNPYLRLEQSEIEL